MLLFSVSHTGYVIEEFFSASNFYCHCVPTVMLIRLNQTPAETVTIINIVVICQLSLKLTFDGFVNVLPQ